MVYAAKAGVTICANWRCWSSTPTAAVPEGVDPFDSERDALGQALTSAGDRSFAFLRDACVLDPAKSVGDIFDGMALAYIDAFVQQFEGRMSGVMTDDERRVWLLQHLAATVQAVVDGRVGKMAKAPTRKATVN